MPTNRPVFRKGVAPCVAGVFVALFSAGASGAKMPMGDPQHREVYSLAELMAGKYGPARTEGWMKVLVPDPGMDATDFVSIYEQIIEDGIRADEWGFGVVAAFTPASSYTDVRYHIDGMDLMIAAGMEEQAASKHMTIVYPWENEAFTLGKVEPLMALSLEGQASEGEIAYRLVDSYFSIAGDEPTLTLEGTDISMQLAMIESSYETSHWDDL